MAFGYGLNVTGSGNNSYLAICAVVKMEPDILEWVDYHRRMGCGRFYIFDSAPSFEDAMNGTLQTHIDSGLVQYTWLGGVRAPQYVAYRSCLSEHRLKHTFMAFIDVDEFIVLVNKTQSIPSLLRQYEPYGGLALNWKLFGSSGHISRPEGGVLRNYHHCVKSHHVKTIGNLKHVAGVVSPHVLSYNATYTAVDEHFRVVSSYSNPNASFDVAYIHHYVIKSVEDFVHKLERGNAWGGGSHKTWKFFEAEDKRVWHSPCLALEMPEEGSRQ
jgi:hypothetical protein